MNLYLLVLIIKNFCLLRGENEESDLWTPQCWGWCASSSGIPHSSSGSGSQPRGEGKRMSLQSGNHRRKEKWGVRRQDERMEGIRGIFMGNGVDISWREKTAAIFDFNIWFIWLSEQLHPMSQQNRLSYAILGLAFFFTYPLSGPLLLQLFCVRPSWTHGAREGGEKESRSRRLIRDAWFPCYCLRLRKRKRPPREQTHALPTMPQPKTALPSQCGCVGLTGTAML